MVEVGAERAAALEKAQQGALRMVCLLNASIAKPEGGVLFEEAELDSLIQQAGIATTDAQEKKTREATRGEVQEKSKKERDSQPAAAAETKARASKRELMLQAAESRLKVAQSVAEAKAVNSAASAFLNAKHHQTDNRRDHYKHTVVPVMNLAELGRYLGKLTGSAVTVRRLRKFQELVFALIQGPRHVMNLYHQDSWHANGLQCAQWDATDVYHFTSQLGILPQFFNSFDSDSGEINGQWLLGLAVGEIAFRTSSRGADESTSIRKLNHFALESLRCAARQQLLYHSAVLLEMSQWFQRFCREERRVHGTLKLAQELSYLHQDNHPQGGAERQQEQLLYSISNSAEDIEALIALCSPTAPHGPTGAGTGTARGSEYAHSAFAFQPPRVVRAISEHPRVREALQQMQSEYAVWLEQQKRALADTVAADREQAEEDSCPLCLLSLSADASASDDRADLGDVVLDLVVTTSCGHRFHLGCLRKSRQLSSDTCPMCRTPLAPGLTPKGRAKWARSIRGTRQNSVFGTGAGTRAQHGGFRSGGSGSANAAGAGAPRWGHAHGGSWSRPSTSGHSRPLFD